MATRDELADPGIHAPTLESPDWPAWWQSRSSDELQAIVHRGVRAGDLFFAAVNEMERRARDAEAAHRAVKIEAAEIFRRRQIIVLAVVLFLAVAAVAIMRFEGL